MFIIIIRILVIINPFLPYHRVDAETRILEFDGPLNECIERSHVHSSLPIARNVSGKKPDPLFVLL